MLFGYAAAPPGAGQIVHLADPFEEPAGGAAVAAVTLARAGVDVVFFTALAADADAAAMRPDPTAAEPEPLMSLKSVPCAQTLQSALTTFGCVGVA